VRGEEVIEYYHRGVVCHLVGFDIAAPLDVEMLRPGEGEITAAKRLLERGLGPYGRFFDAVVGDALYLEAPFFNFCLEHGKHVLAVIKGDQRLLLQDAQGLFAGIKPRVWDEPGRRTRFWDEEGFTSCEGVKAPVRVLHAEETVTERKRIAKKWVEKTHVHDWWWGTTIPALRLPSRRVWQAGHGRWDIENDLFNTLVTHWALNHCFKHDPKAIVNFVLTLFIAFVLLQSFYHRNLKAQRRAHLTLIGLGDALYRGLHVLGIRAPWIDNW
jgi:hypothetical protein